MAFPSVEQYIYSACTNQSFTACCLSDQEVIVARYTGASGNFIGCMISDGTLTASTVNVVEMSNYIDCYQCGDIVNDYGTQTTFISC